MWKQTVYCTLPFVVHLRQNGGVLRIRRVATNATFVTRCTYIIFVNVRKE